MEKKRYFFGEWRDGSAALTVGEAEELLQLAEARRASFRNYPLDKVFAVLSRLQARWADPNYPLRKTLEAKLPEVTGFSPEMIALAFQEMSWTLSPELLEKKLKTELRGVGKDFWGQQGAGTLARWEPLGTVLHVLSGNVFLVALGSFVEGVITGNLTILKQASEEQTFLPLFIQSLEECDPEGEVRRSLAVIDYPSKAQDVMQVLKQGVDGIVLWGGEDAVRAYRDQLPARTRMIVFGPKLSFAVVTQKGLLKKTVNQVAMALADEVAIWDQNACTAPQLVFVEGKGTAKILSGYLGEALAKKQQSLPCGPAETNTAVEIQKLRGVAMIAEARGLGALECAKGSVDWTVIVSEDKTIEPSPLHRTIKLVEYEDVSEVLSEMRPVRGYLQTVGLACDPSELSGLSDALLKAGALRLLPLGEMSGGEIDDPHDGAYDLTQLGNFVYTRDKATFAPEDSVSPEARQALIDSRLRRLVSESRRAPYYAELLAGKEIQTTQDLLSIPILSRVEMEKHMLPHSKALETRPPQGGYVTRSGGSTGTPKFSLYDGQDWERLVSNAVRVFQAAGLVASDRIANCMLAGDLYGSFVSFDHINSRLGAMTFAFAGGLKPDVFLTLWKEWGINVLEGMPTVFMPLFRELKAKEPTFGLEKILYGGVPLSASDRKWLKEELGVRRVSSIIGANDGGQLAYQCAACEGNVHHLLDDYNYVEFLDEDDQPVPEGQVGKIVITTLLKYNYPLIRYEIGDQGRLLSGPCPCGRTSRRFEYLGRSDDALCIGLLNVGYQDISSAVSDLPFSVLQLVGANDPNGEHLILRAEVANRPLGIEEQIRERVLEKVPAVARALAAGHLTKLVIELKVPGDLPRNPRTGKVKLVVDERA